MPNKIKKKHCVCLKKSRKFENIIENSIHFGRFFSYKWWIIQILQFAEKMKKKKKKSDWKGKKINMEHPKIDVDRRNESLLCVTFAWKDEVSFIFFLGTIFWKWKCVKILPLRNSTRTHTHVHAWDAVYLQTFPRAYINFRTLRTHVHPPTAFITVYKYSARIMRTASKRTHLLRQIFVLK